MGGLLHILRFHATVDDVFMYICCNYPRTGADSISCEYLDRFANMFYLRQHFPVFFLEFVSFLRLIKIST